MPIYGRARIQQDGGRSGIAVNTGKGRRGCGNRKRRQRVVEGHEFWSGRKTSSSRPPFLLPGPPKERGGRQRRPSLTQVQGRKGAHCPPACGAGEDSCLLRRGWLPRGSWRWVNPPCLGAPICLPELDLSPRSRENLPLRPEALDAAPAPLFPAPSASVGQSTRLAGRPAAQPCSPLAV